MRIAWGPAARDFGRSQGGAVGASPQRAVTAEPTPAADKRPAARRVSKQRAAWLRCASVTDRWRVCSLVAPRHAALCSKTGPHGIFNQAPGQDAGELRVVLLDVAHGGIDLRADVLGFGAIEQVIEPRLDGQIQDALGVI